MHTCLIPCHCRLKEFSERWEVDKYLSASGYLPPNVKPFFVALPKDRSAATSTSADWRRAIQEVEAGVKQHLRDGVAGGFDEERFATRVGFGNLRRQAPGTAEKTGSAGIGTWHCHWPSTAAWHDCASHCRPYFAAEGSYLSARTCPPAPPLLAAGSWRRSWRVGTATPPPPPWRCCRSGARQWHRSSSLLTGSCRRRGMWCPCAAQVCGFGAPWPVVSDRHRQSMGSAQPAVEAATATDSCRAQVARQFCHQFLALPDPLTQPTAHPPAAIQHVLGVAGKVEGILEGSPLIDPMQWGWTTEEERAAATGSNVGAGSSSGAPWEALHPPAD